MHSERAVGFAFWLFQMRQLQPAYNLSGQRVEDAAKGIVVKNGKKLGVAKYLRK